MKKILLIIIISLGLSSCGKNYEKIVKKEIIEALKTKGLYEEVDKIEVEFSRDLVPEKIVDNMIEKNQKACKLYTKYKNLNDSIEKYKEIIYKGDYTFSEENVADFKNELYNYDNIVKPIFYIDKACEDQNLSTAKELHKALDSIDKVKEYNVTLYPKKESKQKKETVSVYLNLRTEEVTFENFDGTNALSLQCLVNQIDDYIEFLNNKIKVAQRILFIIK